MNVLLVPVLLVPGFAAAPLVKSQESREIEALTRAADASFEAASRVNQRLLLDADLSPERRTKLQRQHRLALERAANRYDRLARSIEALKTPSAARKQQATSAELKSAKCRFNLGQYEKALAVYERLIDRSQDKRDRLDALGGAVMCHAAKAQVNEMKQRLLQIEKAIKTVPDDVRDPWQKWLDEVKKVLADAV